MTVNHLNPPVDYLVTLCGGPPHRLGAQLNSLWDATAIKTLYCVHVNTTRAVTWFSRACALQEAEWDSVISPCRTAAETKENFSRLDFLKTFLCLCFAIGSLSKYEPIAADDPVTYTVERWPILLFVFHNAPFISRSAVLGSVRASRLKQGKTNTTDRKADFVAATGHDYT